MLRDGRIDDQCGCTAKAKHIRYQTEQTVLSRGISIFEIMLECLRTDVTVTAVVLVIASKILGFRLAGGKVTAASSIDLRCTCCEI